MGREIATRKALAPDAIYGNDDEAADLASIEVYEGVRLTPKEIAFVDAYCGEAHFVGSAAYRIAAGVANDSNRIGSAWLKKPHIIRAIQDRLNTNGLSAEAALQELKDVALADWRDLVEVKMRNGEVIDAKIDLAPKVRALEIILRAHNRLDNKTTAQAAIVVNINTPGLSEDELA